MTEQKRLCGVDVSFSKGIKDFHRAIEIPLDVDLIRGENQIIVVFDQNEFMTGNTKIVTAKISTTRRG